jgi:Papain-like cysteine protease AvrRpt2
LLGQKKAGLNFLYIPNAESEFTMPEKKIRFPKSLKFYPLCIRRRPCGNPLGFTMQHQQQTQWCWAANAVSVNLYYHPSSGRTQCAVVNTHLGQTTCCQNGSTAQCNQPSSLSDVLSEVGNLNAFTTTKDSLSKIKGEINGCRPVCLRIGWNGGGGHFVAIYGYSGNNINIGDPWYGTSVQDYGSMPSSYHGGGSWTHTYTTKS